MQLMAAARWTFSVGGKVFRVVPGATLLVVLCTLVSQVAALLAALLPLKVVILLGSANIPSYFPSLLHGYGRPTLVLALCAAAIKFFILHLLAEALIGKLSAYGARTLIARSRKLSLFENQEQLLSKAYQRFAGAQAGAVFILLAGALLLKVYPLQALVISGYLAIVWIVLVSTFRYSPTFRGKPAKELIHLIGVLANVGFFVTFGCIVVDILLGSNVSMLWAIAALLLVRQVFRRVVAFVTDLTNLYQQRLQLNALLFQGHVYVGKAPPVGANGMWALAQADTLPAWLTPLIARVVEHIEGEPQTNLLPSGMADLLMWTVDVQAEGDHRRFLVKLFGKNRTALARHEASLFSEMNEPRAPLARLCLVEQVESFHCHVFEWPGVAPIEPQQSKRAALAVTSSLFAVRPDASLVALFSRSRPMLWQRLDEQVVPRLHLFANEAEGPLVERLADSLAGIKARLESMQLTIMTSDLGPDALWHDSGKEVWACHWGRWTLEPLGAGWPVNERIFPLLPAALAEAEKQCVDLSGVDVADVRLAALAFAFDKACQRQAYRMALELLDPMLESYENR